MELCSFSGYFALSSSPEKILQTNSRVPSVNLVVNSIAHAFRIDDSGRGRERRGGRGVLWRWWTESLIDLIVLIPIGLLGPVKFTGTASSTSRDLFHLPWLSAETPEGGVRILCYLDSLSLPHRYLWCLYCIWIWEEYACTNTSSEV
jgi:hypothetical protein